MKKFKSWFLITCFSLALIPTIPFEAQAANDRALREGTCWCDGVTNCRYKKTGKSCTDRDACSVGACATLVIKAAAAVALFFTD